eukprot:1160867-Pelagomonas_calceolata.AAC.4
MGRRNSRSKYVDGTQHGPGVWGLRMVQEVVSFGPAIDCNTCCTPLRARKGVAHSIGTYGESEVALYCLNTSLLHCTASIRHYSKKPAWTSGRVLQPILVAIPIGHLGVVVWLNGPTDLLAKRVAKEGIEKRPLLASPDNANPSQEQLYGTAKWLLGQARGISFDGWRMQSKLKSGYRRHCKSAAESALEMNARG